VLRQPTDLPWGAFPLKGSNWSPPGPQASAAQWKAELALLDRMQRELREAGSMLAPADLDRPSAQATVRLRLLILGVAARDLHRGGQIQLIKRLVHLE